MEIRAHVVDNLCANPNADIGGRDGDRHDIGLRHEVRLGLLDSLRRGVGLGGRLRVDVDLCLRLRGGKRVLDRAGLVDDLGRDPDTSGGDELSGRDDLRLGLEVGHDLSHGLRHRDGGGDGLCLFDRQIRARVSSKDQTHLSHRLCLRHRVRHRHSHRVLLRFCLNFSHGHGLRVAVALAVLGSNETSANQIHQILIRTC